MSERSISMVTPMVLATRAGTKTNTRRIIKFKENGKTYQFDNAGPLTSWSWIPEKGILHFGMSQVACPYGKAGDVLKLKEAAWLWCEKVRDGLTPKKRPKYRYVPVEGAKVLYVADMPRDALKPATPQAVPADRVSGQFVWRLKIPRYLPAWAVRTRLQIVSVRVERLQDITEEDARAEGIEPGGFGRQDQRLYKNYSRPLTFNLSPVESFRTLWESINGPDSWASNVWVWRIEFKKV